MIHRLLTHPAYGGAYAYGRTSSEPHYDGPLPRRGIRRKPRGEWLTLLPGTHEGYVDWPRWEAIRKMITSNQFRAEQPGAAKRGAALLAGLIRCRRCGRRMMVYYTGCNHDVPRYACRRGSLDNGEPRCIAFGGRSADEAIEGELLRVLEPAAIEAALDAQPRAMPPTRHSDNTTPPTPPIVWWRENWSYAGIALSGASLNWRTELNSISARPR